MPDTSEARAAASAAADRGRAALAGFRDSIKPGERAAFFKRGPRGNVGPLAWLVVLGAVLTPIPLLGAVLGFRRAYKRVLEPQHIAPALSPLDPVARFGMVVGAVLAVAFILAGLVLLAFLRVISGGLYEAVRDTVLLGGLIWLQFTVPGTVLILAVFLYWLRQEQARAAESGRYGSARFATPRETEQFASPAPLAGQGFFVGWDADAARTLFYPRQGHRLTVGGTRSGKGVSLLVPSLLLDAPRGSWVVVDPKGENAAIAAPRLRQLGKRVVLLNPWGLLADDFAARGFNDAAQFNPLDLLAASSPLNLVDDVDILAEMIVPLGPGGVDLSTLR